MDPSSSDPDSPMSLKIYIDGKLYDKENAKISVYDHGLLYGDGVFEGMRSYGGRVFRLAEHIDRLWDSAKAIWLEIPMTKAEMTKAVNDTLAVNEIKDGYVRLVVTRGVGTLGLDPNKCAAAERHHHRRPHRALSRGVVREGADDRHRPACREPIRRR